MNFRRPDIKSRLLSPRIFIYAAILLIVAWWINRFGQFRQEAAGQPASPEQPRAVSEHSDSGLPLLVVVALPGEEVEAVVAEAQKRHQGVCRITLASTELASAANAMEIFQVGKLPAALLYDSGNQEIARFEGELSGETLDALAEKARAQSSP
ncbi:MAG: hypothetical protein II943_03445 [Victivallales bacterium]|nr:hypothetical protein [Victivallales bacterium]